MFNEFQNMSDEQLAQAADQAKSLDSHRREMEFRLRELEVQRDVVAAQIGAAKWTKWSAIAVMVSVVVTAVGIWLGFIKMGRPINVFSSLFLGACYLLCLVCMIGLFYAKPTWLGGTLLLAFLGLLIWSRTR